MESCQNLVVFFSGLRGIFLIVNVMVKIFVNFGHLKLGIRLCMEPHLYVKYFNLLLIIICLSIKHIKRLNCCMFS